jgi:ELWxxDGT repeat protein
MEVHVRTGRLLLLPAAVICAAAAIAPGAPARAGSSAAPAAQGKRPLAHPVAALVADIARGAASSAPADLTAMNRTLFFTADDGRHGRDLWRSNGTAAGTVRLTGPGTASPAADPRDLTVADGVLFFSAFDPRHGRELWRSNGRSAGTTLVADIVPGPRGSDPQDITYAVGQQVPSPDQVLVYFSAWDPAHGRELWRSNGTAKGTVLVADINPGPASSNPAGIAPVAFTFAMFSANDGAHGREPWTTDGTAAGTALYADLNPGPAGSDPANITPSVLAAFLGNFPFWYFTATTPATGRDLFAAYSPALRFGNQAIPYDINPGPATSTAARAAPAPATSPRSAGPPTSAPTTAPTGVNCGRSPCLPHRPPSCPARQAR